MPNTARRHGAAQNGYADTVSRPVSPGLASAQVQSLGAGAEAPGYVIGPLRRNIYSPGSTESERPRGSTTASLDNEPRDTKAVRRLPEGDSREERLWVLQKFEGTVVSVIRDEFVAVIRDLTNPSQPKERATFLIEDVSESDRPLVEDGAVFYWSLGYETSAAGQRKRISLVRFRRLPLWSESDAEVVERETDELEKIFGTGRPDPGTESR